MCSWGGRGGWQEGGGGKREGLTFCRDYPDTVLVASDFSFLNNASY